MGEQPVGEELAAFAGRRQPYVDPRAAAAAEDAVVAGPQVWLEYPGPGVAPDRPPLGAVVARVWAFWPLYWAAGEVALSPMA